MVVWVVSLSTMKLIPHRLTAALSLTGIRSLADFGKLVGPLGHPVLYLRQETRNAAPKCISGRTSYHRVCLAFHPYPQVIPQVFNLGGFGPPRGLTLASACPWIDHSASGLPPATGRPVRTRFRSGSPSRVNLATDGNSPAHSSKGTPSRTAGPKPDDDALTACKPTVSGSISLPSRGTFHPSLTVLVHYRSPACT